MPSSNAVVTVHLGNVTGRIAGPAPSGVLDRALNPHLPVAPGARATISETDPALVYDPAAQTFLMGALPQVKRVLRDEGIRFTLRDRRALAPMTDETSWQLTGPRLRDYQAEVVREAVIRGSGLIDIGTGGGKTLLAAAIIAGLQVPSLYVVTSRPLLTQAIENLEGYLGVTPGVIGAGMHRPRPLTVALIQALSGPYVDVTPWKHRCMIFDEGHHACAPSYLRTIRAIDARYNYFLSAVPFRSGRDQHVLDALTGGTLTGGKYSASYLIENGYACPAEVMVERVSSRDTTFELPFQLLYEQGIVKNDARNERIADIAGQQVDRGAAVLVLVDRILHGRTLRTMIPGSAFVSGKTGRARLELLAARFRNGRLGCLIATAGLFQEGVSIDGIEVLIQAGGLKSRAKVLQSIGRGLRQQKGKDRCLYVDFLDHDEGGMLMHHSLQRLQTLAEEGFPVPPVRDLLPHGVLRSPEASNEPIAAAWSHVSGTKRFLLIDGDGNCLDQAYCIEPEIVPRNLCKGCIKRDLCQPQD